LEQGGVETGGIMAPMGAALFVYGTLMPGHLRWELLTAHARHHRPATVPGVLYDTGNGWPAADLSAALGKAPVDAGSVPGWFVELDAGGVAELLSELDAMEGISSPPDPATDPYVRVSITVATVDGAVTAWAYHATVVEPTWRRIERWEGIAER
jgi:gamma-glutamylcyclotransferase (GGCT)/AIG2-like uncharacterized protein YtfP